VYVLPLTGAYRQMLDAAHFLAQRVADGSGPEEVGWLLAHAASYDHLLVDAATDLAAGRAVVIDNAPATCMSRLATVVAGHDLRGLIRLAGQRAEQVIGAVAAVPPSLACRLVQVRLTNRNERRVFDEPMRWSDVLMFHTEEEIPHRTSRLTQLARDPGECRPIPRRTGRRCDTRPGPTVRPG
jgi:hypothetical protein